MKKNERRILKLKDLKKSIYVGKEEKLSDRIVYERLQSREQRKNIQSQIQKSINQDISYGSDLSVVNQRAVRDYQLAQK